MVQVDIIFNYFKDLSPKQIEQFKQLEYLYKDWNQKINVVSRKDIDELYLRHVLHSLSIAKVIEFKKGSEILDVGTGGGFPGVPLAILFPEVQFTLVDSIGKKIKVVEDVVRGLELKNVKVVNSRVEEISGQFDFIISRAVAAMPTFVRWVNGKIHPESKNDMPNGILYLKGGDLSGELADFPEAEFYELTDYFDDPFFESKKVVYLPMS